MLLFRAHFRYEDTFMNAGESADLQILSRVIVNNLFYYHVGTGGSIEPDLRSNHPCFSQATFVAIRLLQSRYNIVESDFWRLLYPHDNTHVAQDGRTSFMNSFDRGEAVAEWLAHASITEFAAGANNGRTKIMTRPWARFIVRSSFPKPDRPTEHRIPSPHSILFHNCCMSEKRVHRMFDLLALHHDAPEHVTFATTKDAFCCIIGDIHTGTPTPICCCGNHTSQHTDDLVQAAREHINDSEYSQNIAYSLLNSGFRLLAGLMKRWLQSADNFVTDQRLAEITAIAMGVAYCCCHGKDSTVATHIASALNSILQLHVLFVTLRRPSHMSAVSAMAGEAMHSIRQVRKALERPDDEVCVHFFCSSPPAPLIKPLHCSHCSTALIFARGTQKLLSISTTSS